MVSKAKYPKGSPQKQPELTEMISNNALINENRRLSEQVEAINQLCIKHQVDKLYLVGSAARGELTPLSDVDFLVKFKEFDLECYLENFLQLKESLEIILDREVDLIEEQTLKNPVLIRSVNRSKRLLYG